MRTIDWNVTARTGEPHVKRFVEERELTVMLLVDVSAEQADVLAEQSKRCRRLADATYDRQTCGVLAAMADDYAKTAEALASKPD